MPHVGPNEPTLRQYVVFSQITGGGGGGREKKVTLDNPDNSFKQGWSEPRIKHTNFVMQDKGDLRHGGLVKFWRFLDMQPIGHKTFAKHTRSICELNKIVVTRLLDVVSYDGSWMTHGHKLQYGIGCDIDLLTGLVLDLQIMSLYCQRCAYANTRYGGMDTKNFKHWFWTNEPECK